jgi:hypothetical protein
MLKAQGLGAARALSITVLLSLHTSPLLRLSLVWVWGRLLVTVKFVRLLPIYIGDRVATGLPCHLLKLLCLQPLSPHQLAHNKTPSACS